jgi:hypothetical protein
MDDDVSLSDELPAAYLDQYKLAVEMADRVSARRGAANTFFLTVNTALAAVLGGKELRWYVAVAGVAFAISWWALLRSYRALNTAKWTVIVELERRLPAHPFAQEWTMLRSAPAPRNEHRRWTTLRRYRELGAVERLVPWLFVGLYVAEIIRQATD